MKKLFIFLILLFLVGGGVVAQSRQDSSALATARWQIDKISKGMVVKTVSFRVFDSDQQITVLEYDPSRYITRVIQSDELTPVSVVARKSAAIAAINGSFYNMRTGWPTTFIRSGGTGYGPVSADDPMLNGAIVATGKRVGILPWNAQTMNAIQAFYPDVMQAGPFLVSSGRLMPIRADRSMTVRHPRTAVGVVKNRVLLLVADGRHAGHAEGLTLSELAWLMQQLGCTEALNLDGGGSSTLWAGTVRNYPCDNRKFDHGGERPVANVVLVEDN